jgi:hypothetical protein
MYSSMNESLEHEKYSISDQIEGLSRNLEHSTLMLTRSSGSEEIMLVHFSEKMRSFSRRSRKLYAKAKNEILALRKKRKQKR